MDCRSKESKINIDYNERFQTFYDEFYRQKGGNGSDWSVSDQFSDCTLRCKCFDLFLMTEEKRLILVPILWGTNPVIRTIEVFLIFGFLIHIVQ